MSDENEFVAWVPTPNGEIDLEKIIKKAKKENIVKKFSQLKEADSFIQKVIALFDFFTVTVSVTYPLTCRNKLELIKGNICIKEYTLWSRILVPILIITNLMMSIVIVGVILQNFGIIWIIEFGFLWLFFVMLNICIFLVLYRGDGKKGKEDENLSFCLHKTGKFCIKADHFKKLKYNQFFVRHIFHKFCQTVDAHRHIFHDEDEDNLLIPQPYNRKKWCNGFLKEWKRDVDKSRFSGDIDKVIGAEGSLIYTCF